MYVFKVADFLTDSSRWVGKKILSDLEAVEKL